MPQGNWKCSTCGGTITELPFQPRSEAGLTCRSCYAKKKAKETEQPPEMQVATEAPDIPDFAELSGGPDDRDDFGMGAVLASSEKPKTTGNWTCSSCGAAITSLPFTPRDTSNLKCLDCFKRSKQ
jgi:CxxC-x17-CxxC domain-containing protein